MPYAGDARPMCPPPRAPERHPVMTFEGCVVVHLEPGAWYVCVPPVCEGNEHCALTRPASPRRRLQGVQGVEHAGAGGLVRADPQSAPADHADIPGVRTHGPP